MKYTRKILAFLTALLLIFSLASGVTATTAEEATVDPERTGSIDLYKYDLTAAEADGVWDSSYVSTGIYDEIGINAILGDPNRVKDLGNGEVSYGYALKGVEFTYVQVAELQTYSAIVEEDGEEIHKTMLLYKMTEGEKTAAFLKILGLSYEDCYAPATVHFRGAKPSIYCFASEVLVSAMSKVLSEDPTAVKNAAESFANTYGVAMAETDSYGHTEAEDLALGLYLLVETGVPEMVTATTNPFLLSVPMTTVNGSNAQNGGEEWLYEITVYPKNETGKPTLEKTVREAAEDTGKHNGSSLPEDGYAHNATASSGDTVEYQIISKLPTITSQASFLSDYTFVDTLSKGISYVRNDLVLEFFTDESCTNSIARWTQSDASPKFAVSYVGREDGAENMTIFMTEQGLEEINHSVAVYTPGQVNAGYSDCYLRITYKATVDRDASLTLGDSGNPNEVLLIWKRSNGAYYDTLQDDAHVYSYGLDLTKRFSDEDGNFANVEFLLFNGTDGYYVCAEQAEAGVYYVTAFVSEEENATRFVPAEDGHIVIRGLEDDTYYLTEVKTDDGYVLLKDDICLEIATAESSICDLCGEKLLCASAKVDQKEVTMDPWSGSANAVVLLTVVNTHGFDLPETGDNGTALFAIGGVLLGTLAVGLLLLLVIPRKKKEQG